MKITKYLQLHSIIRFVNYLEFKLYHNNIFFYKPKKLSSIENYFLKLRILQLFIRGFYAKQVTRKFIS